MRQGLRSGTKKIFNKIKNVRKNLRLSISLSAMIDGTSEIFFTGAGCTQLIAYDLNGF
ncbi:hypothetical protein HY636_05520 [Candidatus Woesearchaeota archaeon]|nr:hypothetical protein [Candidatus Woesearchaeota archaeon]